MNGSPATYGLTTAPEGRTVIAAATNNCFDVTPVWSCEGEVTLARLDPDGELDEEFGEGGRSTSVVSDGLYDLDLLPAPGAYVLDFGANVLRGGAALATSVVLRFGEDGALDSSFGQGGAFLPQRAPQNCGGRSSANYGEYAFGTPERDDFFYQDYGVRGFIHGLGGDDLIRLTGAIRDRICGGSGDDVITARFIHLSVPSDPGAVERRNGPQRAFGEAGRDVIQLGFGNDTLSGGAGPDRLAGGRGHDRILGGPGSDRLRSRDGERDHVNCGEGRDTAIVDRKDRVAFCERVR